MGMYLKSRRDRVLRRYRVVGSIAVMALFGSLAVGVSQASEIVTPPVTQPSYDADRVFAATAAGEPVATIAAGGTASLGAGVDDEGAAIEAVAITAPSDRRSFITDDSMIAILKTGQQQADFGLPAGASATVEADGSVTLTRDVETMRAEDGSAVVTQTAILNAPWAKDATGRHLATHYTVSGSTLTQHVDTTGATYPVAADPLITVGWGLYLNLYGYQAKTIASAVIAAGGAGAWIVCSGITKLPVAIQKVAKVVCQAVPTVSLAGVFKAIVNVVNYPGVSTWGCYQSRITYPRTAFKIVNSRNCS